MDKLRALEVFVAVAQTQGFASGARRCRISPPVATRLISDLEASVGVRLFTRTTRSVNLTDAGKRYLADSVRILEEIKEADASAIGLHSSPVGTLVVTASVLFGSLYVMPVVVEYLHQNTSMKVITIFQDKVINLAEEGVDIAVRIGDLPDSGLHAARVGAVRRVICGSKAYLKRYGVPVSPKDIVNHTLIAPVQLNPIQDWRFGVGDKSETVRVSPRLVTTTNDSAIEAARMGLGLTRVLSYQVAKELGNGSLVTCLEDHEPDPLPINIVHREGLRSTAKTRIFIDLLIKMLGSSLNAGHVPGALANAALAK